MSIRNLRCLPFTLLFFLFSDVITAQSDNTIFTVQKASLNRDVLEYSPLYLGGQWIYTQLENEAVLMYSLGNDKSTPISGFNLRKSNVTGFAKSDHGGLIAISYGDKKTNVPAKLRNNKIWFAYQDKTGFASKYFEFALNSDQYSCTTPFLSPDGTKLYFASDKPGGYGGFDLYVCDYRGKEWSKPRNLGPVINTDKDEVYPYLVDNMMFFSSNGHGGARMDIFIADMGNDRGRLVLNAGVPINSPADDYAMTFDNSTRTGYFLSDRDGVNGKAFQVTNDKKLLLINIKANEDKKPISGAKLDLSRCRKDPMYANSRGSIILPVPPGEKCFVQIGKVGYNATTFMIDYNEITGLKKSIDIYLSQEGVFYKGRVIDQDGNPAMEVELSVIDQATGELQYVFTDEDGYYSIALEPLSFYLIRSKSPYFLTKETKFATQASVPASILGVIQLQSNGVKQSSVLPAASMDDVKITTRPAADDRNSSVTDFVETEAAKKIESAKGPETSVTEAQKIMDENDERTRNTVKKEDNIPQVVEERVPEKPVIIGQPEAGAKPAPFRYAIQLAAISPDNTNMKPYQDKTSGKGQIYYVREGNLNKVRLGFFETREDALAVRDQLPSDLRKGFIVEVRESEYNTLLQSYKSNAGTTNINATPAKSNPPAIAQPAAAEKPVNVTTPVTGESRAEYKIRLSTLRDPKLFNSTQIKQLGLIEEVKNGNLTTFYLAGFESKAEAVEVIEKVRTSGFPSAQIVKLQDGEYSIDN